MIQVKEFGHTYYSNEEDMSKLNAYLYPSIKKYTTMEKEDKIEFKSILQAFLRAYTFIAQVSRMMDKEMQMKYIFCKYLSTVLPRDSDKGINLDDKIDLQYYKLEKKFEGSIELTEEEGKLEPPTGAIGKNVEEEVTLSQIVDKINDKYRTEFTNMDKVFEQLTLDFMDDETMVEYAKNNDEEAFRKVYNGEFPKKAISRYQQNNELFEKIMAEYGAMDEVMNSLFRYVYKRLKDKKEDSKLSIAEDTEEYKI